MTDALSRRIIENKWLNQRVFKTEIITKGINAGTDYFEVLKGEFSRKTR
jgi:hypothetical protein